MNERFARILPEQMTPQQEEVYATFRGGPALAVPHPTEGGLSGPPGLWLLNPRLAQIFRSFSGALRSELGLSSRSKEIAVLLHAHHRASSFEVFAHRRAGMTAGLSEEEVEGLATRVPPAFATDEERSVFETTISLLDRQALDDAEYAAAVDVLGERRLFELVSLVGFYDMIATQLAVFGVKAPGE
ncbi:hypothetical protein GCM10011490_22900 [Pseudoclavibacter endophyticus]|uniref:Carboxymuconolactone decarboxylase family protein n=1 Tax=Pseudoclavibacter endophyticus TaxID=1778590 RepID=A0A6H9WII2_9MICO|nr:carboxymuconolactone decarboxylase family protein [Pseudoclavibacter endophyticus]KAB1648317.1 carboxymuconolactone decarboxylase family protein [Pseudoclavibacter endophyticus]GGA71607.1 hypothetical protein GCM10011490_22900 [Pseudoclavibacter endophyticus]